MQQDNDEVMKLGSMLSKKISCSVHYPAFDKHMFECNCHITFPVFIVAGCEESGNWEPVIRIHRDGGRR